MNIIDWCILVLYLFVSLGVGVFFAGRQGSTDEYFLGGQRYGSLLVGISVLATGLSAITFLGVPGYVVSKDWTLLISGAIAVPAAIFVGKVFVPYFYKRRIVSAYQYLEQRFSPTVALLNSSIFLLMRGTLAGVAIYAPSLALSAVTGWDLTVCILVSGVVTVIYTTIGGVSAVIWTDVIQVSVLFGGIIAMIVVIYTQLTGGFFENFQTAYDTGKLTIVDMRLSWTEITLWNSIVGGFIFNVAFYGTDQVLIQRYLASSSEQTAKKSLYLNAAFSLPAIVVFFIAGTLIWLYQQQNPSFFPEGLNSDQLMPYYIVQKLPAGLPGVLIAAIYAAAMSTLSAVLNSLSAVTVTDYYKRFSRHRDDHQHCLRAARWITLLWGGLALVAALSCHRLDESVALAAIKAGSLFSGPMLGTFMLGMFVPRCESRAAFWSGLLGLSTGLVAGVSTSLDVFWLATLSTGTTFFSGLIFQSCFPSKAQPGSGTTPPSPSTHVPSSPRPLYKKRP